jgi:putative hydrolase of the HAD superfamily
MIRAVIFDLDDTLFPESAFVLSGFEAVDAWLRANKSVDGFQKIAATEFKNGRRGDIFDRALAGLGMPHNPELVRELVAVYRDHEPKIQLFADAQEVLEGLASKNELGLLTDGYLTTQKRKVATLGIADRFRAIVYSDELGHAAWKPSPIPYTRIAAALGCLPSECAYVGDNPTKDFITARQLDWFTVRVRRPGGEHFRLQLPKTHEADVEIASLVELNSALQAIA